MSEFKLEPEDELNSLCSTCVYFNDAESSCAGVSQSELTADCFAPAPSPSVPAVESELPVADKLHYRHYADESVHICAICGKLHFTPNLVCPDCHRVLSLALRRITDLGVTE